MDFKPKQIVMCQPMHWKDAGEVRIMAVAEGYAMVRRKGCMPFAVSLKDLDPTKEPRP